MNLAAELARRGLRLQDEDVVDSTNRIAMDAARAGAPAGLVVRARAQTAGRGRQGRSWSAAPGDALLVSFLRRPRLPPARAVRLTLATGLAVRDVAAESGVDAWVKWPNDVLVGRRKLAGVLCEWAAGALVVGVGINLGTDALPADVRATAAALGPADPDDLLLRLTDRLLALEAAVDGDGWDGVRARCVAAMWPMLGAEMMVDGSPASVLGLDEDGALLVLRPGAEGPERVIAGDVHLGTEAAACCS